MDHSHFSAIFLAVSLRKEGGGEASLQQLNFQVVSHSHLVKSRRSGKIRHASTGVNLSSETGLGSKSETGLGSRSEIGLGLRSETGLGLRSETGLGTSVCRLRLVAGGSPSLVPDLDSRIQDFSFRDQASGFRISGFTIEKLGLRVYNFGFGVWGSESGS